MLAINPNDAERYPRDSYDAMRERVASEDGWPMPYLRDESQEVARAYGAKTTPDCFVIAAEGGSPTAARPMPTTRTRRTTPPGCVTPSTPCSRVPSQLLPRRSRLAARSSGSADRPRL
ncbi:MAG: hypothetical protein ACJ76K_18555 [Solirubrobacteraceae bacterium]